MMDRRRGGSALSTPRRESDEPIFLSGLADGVTTGEPLVVRILNQNQRSGDYAGFSDTPRPSHADYSAQMRYGREIDLRGGGHFSARLTAPLVALGELARQALAQRGISVGAHLEAVGAARDCRYQTVGLSRDELLRPARRDFPVLDETAGEGMKREILSAAEAGDSVGGVIECGAIGLPAGIGSPLGGGLENLLASAMFVLGGVRGIEFGDGFAAAAMHGSEHNDPYCIQNGRVACATNHAGGIVGGISTGMPILFRVAMKPTASIAIEQKTVSLSKMEETTIRIGGRHDPCIALRAVPCVEAVASLVLLEAILEREESK
jgi:chorismate synthase